MNEEQRADFKRVLEFANARGCPMNEDFFEGLILGCASMVCEGKGVPLEFFDFDGSRTRIMPHLISIRDELLAEEPR